MKRKVNFSNEQMLGLCRYALLNAEEHARISKALEEIGYSSEKLAEGRKLFEETRQAYHTCLKGREIKKHYSGHLAEKKEELVNMFEEFRLKVRYLFKDQPAMISLLSASGSLPLNLDKLLEGVRASFQEALVNQEIREKLAELNVTPEDLNAGLAKIEEVEAARAEYMRYKGDSQDFTQMKDESFEKLSDWMSSFYMAAKLGLKGNPQLLEPLGKVVKR